MPFTAFNPSIDSPELLVDAILNPSLSGFSLVPGSVSYTGIDGQASFYDGSLDLTIDTTTTGIGPGILLTSGTGTPPQTNTSGSFTEAAETGGDADLEAIKTTALPSAGPVQDVNILEFQIEITNPEIQSIGFSLAFGSDEFPEFSSSSFIDVAGVLVNGTNEALFNNDPEQPLSVIDLNLEVGNFQDNVQSLLPIEYDGLSEVLSIVVPVNQGINTIKIAIGDTGDTAFDSGLFVSNLRPLNIQDGGDSGIVIEVPGTDDDDNIEGSDQDEFIEAGDGNDNVDAGAGNDIVDGGDGNDNIDGGDGNDNVNGGAGNDNVSGGAGNDNVSGGAGNDNVSGVAGEDNITVDSGNDNVSGGDDNDNIIIINDAAGDVKGDDGDDIIDATQTTGSSQIDAGAGNDIVLGGSGNEKIVGGDGDDVINGNGGLDALFGNAGSDTFILEAGEGRDTIFDFTQGDIIDVAGELTFGTGNPATDVVLNEVFGSTLISEPNGDDLAFIIDTVPSDLIESIV